MILKIVLFSFFISILHFAKAQVENKVKASHPINSGMVSISKQKLLDKIKGGWAGQTIGVTFGGPTEFKYCGTMIPDHQKIAWYKGYLKETYLNSPGLYDDIYMDLTFVDVMEKLGLDAPAEEHAKAFANADYELWHANSVARYNIAILGNVENTKGDTTLKNSNMVVELYMDDKLIETAELPVLKIRRRFDLFYAYNKPKGKHTLKIKVVKDNGLKLQTSALVVYTDTLYSYLNDLGRK